MSERSGLYRILGFAPAYERFQRIMGGGHSEVFAEFVSAMKLSPGDRVLDIGCGPGRLVPYLPDVAYVGYEPNPHYVAAARAQFEAKHQFHVGYFDEQAASSIKGINVAIVSAVLHHMNDAEAIDLFALLRQTLAPNGSIVTLDCTLHEGQHPISRLLAKLDRGKHVRSPKEYIGLASSAFENVSGTLRVQQFPPYSHWIMKATNSDMSEAAR